MTLPFAERLSWSQMGMYRRQSDSLGSTLIPDQRSHLGIAKVMDPQRQNQGR